MEKMMYLAAQYLAAAGINFVPKKDDDSHTNMGFSIANNRMETHPLSENGDILSLDYKNFSLNWHSKNDNASLSLNGATHAAVLTWLEETSQTFLKESFAYKLHYDLPYEISDDFKFELTDANRLKELLQLRIITQSTIEKVLADCNLESSIRVWPHHFDSGSYATINTNSAIAVGFGLAIPDTMHSDHYFYISGYNSHGALNTEGFSSLSNGEWKNDGFKGAILSAPKVKESDAVLFFKEAIQNYKSIS